MGNSESSPAAATDDAAAPQARPKKRPSFMGSILGSGKVNPEEQRTKIQRKAVNGNVLVLGMRGSGKTTLVRQLREVVTPFLVEDVRKQYMWDIQRQILQDMQFLVQEANTFGFIWDAKECKEVAESCRRGKVTIEQLEKLAILWKNEPFRDFVKQQAGAGVAPEDNAAYFFDNLERFAQVDYTPSLEEIMMHRCPQKSESQKGGEVWRLNVKDDEHINMYHRLNLIDAGGSEDHRKTWHQHFDDAVVLFYVVSLTDYSHVDAATHRNVLAESFVVYRSLVNSLWFEEGKVKVIVVLAKPDIFEEKIASESIEPYFSRGFAGVAPVTGADGFKNDKAVAFVRNVFKKITPPKVRDRLEVHTVNLATSSHASGTGGTTKSPISTVYESLKAVVVHEGKLKNTVKKLLQVRKSMLSTGDEGSDFQSIVNGVHASLEDKYRGGVKERSTMKDPFGIGTNLAAQALQDAEKQHPHFQIMHNTSRSANMFASEQQKGQR